MSRQTAIAGAMLVVVLGLALRASWGSADFDRRLPVGSDGELAVDIELGSGFSFDRGSLTITSHAEEDVRVVSEVSGWGGYAVDVSVEEKGGDVRVVGRVDGILHWAFGGPTVDVRIWVPPGHSVEARIDGGPLLLEDIVGPVNARVDGSDVVLRRAEGPVTLAASGGQVTVEDVDGTLFVNGGGGEIDVSGVDGRLVVRSERGPVEVESVQGSVEISADRGRIAVSGVRGRVLATTGRGRIEVDDVEGDLEVVTDRGRIDVEGLRGSIRARSGRGGVEVEFVGDPVGAIETDRGSIRVEAPGDARFDLDAESARGDVEVDGDFALARDDEAPDVAAGAPQAPGWREQGEEIAAEFREKVLPRLRENIERGLRDGGWEDLDWEFDWNRDDRGWDFGKHGWSWGEHNWDDPQRLWGRLGRRRGDRVAGPVNGGGKTLRLRTERGSIRVDER